jgi:hypothetical protein
MFTQPPQRKPAAQKAKLVRILMNLVFLILLLLIGRADERGTLGIAQAELPAGALA